jgi:vacuolar-type H+-ATPase subunit E/Vma4
VARGWESKSVESQQDDARSAAEPKRRLTLQQRNLESRKQALQLARSRTLQQIHSAQNPRYRKVLEQALIELDEQLSKLG